MSGKYPFKEIEAKWQKYWEDNQTFKVEEDPSVPKDKRLYLLDMFPYPSAAGLHVGHPEGYTATDIYGRYKVMNGYHVLHPMGYDSFGLPAETYAIKTGTHPKETTEANIENFRKQIKSLGFAYDWSREISTHSEDYYKWTQWIFLKLYEQDLAYVAEVPVWYCEAMGTVLANEEVLQTEAGPISERGHHPVERKPLRQWMLKITQYAERLLNDLDDLDWPESVKAMQRNWIGKSTGANVTFNLENSDKEIHVYTTRPDTLFGATYMVLAPEHELVAEITTPEKEAAIKDYIHKASLKSDLERTELAKDKSGVFTGAYAINPVNGEKVPVWISDYILASYGTGAIMAVPAHDQRDWEFAKKFDLPIVQVLEGGNIEEAAHTEDGAHINSGFMNGMNKQDAIDAMIEFLQKEGKGVKAVNYKLRDWIFSRQRYWGEPFPLLIKEDGSFEPVAATDLPVTLPEVNSYKPTGTGESPLAAIEEWVNTTDASGAKAMRETNTMPQWAGSCWYYLRYLDPHNDKEFAAKDKIDYWMPVDLYVGGAEHAVLHLLYARFWHKVLFDVGLVNTKEPFQRLINQGMITSFAYQRPDKSLVPVDEVEEYATDKFREIKTGKDVEQVIAKMSKSLKNVINPDDIIREFGADSMRMYEMFMGPLQVSKPWSTKGLTGVHRFLDRVWRVGNRELSDRDMTKDELKILHKTIKKVSDDTDKLEFNTAISQMMIFINEIFGTKDIPKDLWVPFIKLLAPYAPHVAEELWTIAGQEGIVCKTEWPSYIEEHTKDDTITVVVQVNGKLRDKLEVAAGTPKDELEKMGLASEKAQQFIDGKNIVKVIVVPNKIVNIVAK